MSKTEMSEAAKQLRREYLKDWKRKNPEKVRGYEEKYWIKKAELLINQSNR